MDCSLADQQQNSVNSLDETIKTLTNLAGGVVVGNSSSPLKSSSSSATSECSSQASATAAVKLRKFSDRSLTTTPDAVKSHTYRISMANLEETQESELDVILGELSLLEAQFSSGPAAAAAADVAAFQAGVGGGVLNGLMMGTGSPATTAPPTRSHSRTNSTISGATTVSISGSSESGSSAIHSLSSGISENGVSGSSSSSSTTSSSHVGGREPRTESPDNDSAFSDTVSLLSSESSASSSVSSGLQQHHKQQLQQRHQMQMHYMQMPGGGGGVGIGAPGSGSGNSSKEAKIQLALHKLEHAPIRRLFVKGFTSDGASKSLLVDERMTCGHVTRLLADKNHVQMQPHWALVENLGDLQMERLFEDHELLVDNLMTWNSDAGNRVLFQQRHDKVALFIKPEIFLPGPQMAPGSQHDEHTRTMLLEEFFETNSQLQVDGPLYMKADSKKGWKRYHFVLRSSGLYYFPKEKTKNTRDLACLTLFNGYNVYRGLGWKKKWKAPTDYTFGFKSAVDSSLGKTCRTLKMLCAEDLETMEKWVTAIRISKYGKQLWENHKTLMEDLSMSDGISNSSFGVSMRSESISSISSAVPSQCGSVSSAVSSMSNSSSGRISRASSSSSSGCLSDDNNGFDSEFTTGTIKRKPSMKPNLPLTSMTRQLKEVGEITIGESGDGCGGVTDLAASPDRNGTLTRRHQRRKSQESNGSGTLKRRPATAAVIIKRGSAESMNAASVACNSGSGSSNSTPTPTPSICSKPLMEYDGPVASAVPGSVSALNYMTSSTLSLDSLPPPPPPPLVPDEQDVYGSQLSLASLPPPPPPEEVMPTPPPPVATMAQYQHQLQQHHHQQQQQQQQQQHLQYNRNSNPPPAVPAKPIKPAVKAAPPYKAPPDYKGGQCPMPPMNTANGLASSACIGKAAVAAAAAPAPPPPVQKKVSFADSPVLLRRKMCSPEPRTPSPQFYSVALVGPMPPPRADVTRLSNSSSLSSASQAYGGSPKRLQESTSNPPRDFLKDLQRVMRKKWQVAQKCKLEPATTPHEVLGFRDFSSDELLAHNLNAAGGAGSHYYRETANVSNWVEEHYGSGAPPVPMTNEYALYENLHANNADAMIETPYPVAMVANQQVAAAAALRKKRPPPPPPKRSDSTHLTHRV